MRNRHLLRSACMGATLLCTAFLFSCGGKSSGNVDFRGVNYDDQQIYIGEDIALAKTQYGTVKGFIMRGIYNFRGIPYGAPTGGKNRFMPPQPPESWSGVLPTVAYGAAAPQRKYDMSPDSYAMFVDHWNYGLINEDCLRLNVWTPGTDSKKRPVMVWMHGGGFTSGSAVEQDSYKGENFARYADVVFVSVNHRLNAFGFSDLSKVGGEKYKNSGNVGMLDLIFALEWVRDNIENFGGDPNNVTIMGQSGGGSKVSTIASMPAAKGLIHKGVALSGSTTGANNKEYAEKLGEYILAEAGLKAGEVDKLQDLSWEEYMDIANRAAAKFRDQPFGLGRAGFSPVADGVNIPIGEYFNPDDPTLPDVPMIYSTTFHERTPSRTRPDLEGITLDGVIDNLRDTYGDDADEIVTAYAKQFPDLRPIEVWAFIVSSRVRVVQSADAKVRQSSPVYMAWFGWDPPLFDGRLRAFHCIDICFWYKNTDVMITHTGGGKTPRMLSDKMATALSAFMRTGNPNTKELPNWPQYTSENGETMVLNNVPEVKNDPDRAARQVMEAVMRN